MTRISITPRAEAQLESIFDNGARHWGFEQAQRYSDAILDAFDRIAARDVVWRVIPPELEAEGFRFRCGRHNIYWRANGEGVTIVAILHDRMNQIERLRDAFD